MDATKSLVNILQEYSIMELDLEMKIKEVLDKIQSDFGKIEYDDNLIADSNWEKDNSAALNRNKRFLKDLKQIKAKLRSSHCYQPASDNLHCQMKKYQDYIIRKYNLKE